MQIQQKKHVQIFAVENWRHFMEEKENIILQSVIFSFSHGFDVYADAQLVRIFVMNVENKCNKWKHVRAKRC